MVRWGKKICTQPATMEKTLSLCLYLPPSAFPQPCLSFLGFQREVLIVAEQQMKLRLQLMGQSEISKVTGTSCLEITMVVYQGTNPSYLSSVITDPTEFCCTVTHGSRKKNFFTELLQLRAPPKKLPKSWTFLLHSSQQQVLRGELGMEK